MSKIKTAYAFLACALTGMVCLSAFSMPTMRASAATAESYDETPIEDDIGDVSPLEYPKNPVGKASLVTFMEYCYTEKELLSENYALYFYLYNPTEKPLRTEVGVNTVEMACAYNTEGNPSSYEQFQLCFLDCTENNRFYKFRLKNPSEFYTLQRTYSSLHSVRRYDISSIQLWDEGAPLPEDYPISFTYKWTGFAHGCGEYANADSTLECNAEELETIQLDLHSTTYRFPYINEHGPGHQNQLDSVYFAVPKEFNERYGDLYRVKCCWNEQKTSPIIVTNRQDVYDDVASHLGTDGSGAKIELYANYDQNQLGEFVFSSADWAFNNTIFEDDDDVDRTPVGYVFKSDKSKIKEEAISSDEIMKWISDHNTASYLFAGEVDEGRTKGYQEHIFTADEPIPLLSFDKTAGGYEKFSMKWEAFWTGKSWDFGEDAQSSVEPIRFIKDSDFTGQDTQDAENLCVLEKDFEGFKAFYEEKKEANNIFLLRFAVTDYYSNYCRAGYYEYSWFPPPGANYFHGDDDSTYMARETVFLKFDIIELTFLCDTMETVIPVVASPIDIVGGVTGPIREDRPGLLDFLLAILGIILIVVIFLLLLRFCPWLIKGVVFVVALPFKAVVAAGKGISKSVKRRREKKQSAKKQDAEQQPPEEVSPPKDKAAK